MEWLVGNILNVIFAAAILIVGFLFAGWAKRFVTDKALDHEELDDTLFTFLGSLARYGLIAVTVIIVMARFGIETTSFIAVLGAAGLAIGLALQGTLSNVAAGVMLMVFRPFKLGQYIEAAGHAGTVREITLFTTELATPDNVQIMVPNSQAIDGVIKNYSGYSTRRVDVTFGIDYGDDIDKAIGIIKSIVDADTRIHRDPEPFAKVVNLGDSSVDIATRNWVDAADYWDVKFDLTKQVKEAFDQQGISIPYPHQVEIVKDVA